MGQSLYINFDAENLLSARVRGANDLRSQNFTQFVAGDSLSLDLFLVGSSGALNIQDYAEVRLGMGGLDSRPESGSYVVAGTDTLSYDHTAAELETVIDSQVAGATVTKLTDFVFKVQFDAVGEQTIPSLDFINVQPRSTVSVTRLTTGTATTKESWLWRLYRNPVAFTNTFTNIAGDGIRGTLSLATAGIYDLLAQNEDVRTFFEVELTDTDGNVRTVLQAKVKLNGEVIGHNFSGSIPTSPTNSPEANAFLESFPDPTIEGDLTVGGFTLPTGAANGYVLNSDASGVGTWRPVAASYPYTADFFYNGDFRTRNLTTIDYTSGYRYDSYYSVYVGSNVTSIGDESFENSSLRSITISNSVTSIGDDAFLDCTLLTSIVIPNSVTSIGNLAFAYCEKLSSVTLSNSITSISYRCFTYCADLLDITIPDSVTSIANEAFSNSGLTSITIPDSVTFLGNNQFFNCVDLSSVTISKELTSIGFQTFRGCTSLSSITIPNNITSIGEKSFINCTALLTAIIGSGVTSIGANAFSNCSSLATINCLATTAPALGGNAFSGTAATEIHVPVGATGYGTTYGGLTVIYDL